MPRAQKGGVNLPEPRDPFARWFGVAAVGVWALVVQSFADPWNKVGAILSPGVGYILGQALQAGVDRFANMSSTRRQRIELENATTRLEKLYKERKDAQENGANSDVISEIELSIAFTQKEKIKIISPPVRRGGRSSSKS